MERSCQHLSMMRNKTPVSRIMVCIMLMMPLFHNPQISLCIVWEAPRGGPPKSRRVPMMSHRRVGLVQGGLFVFSCLPSSNSNARVTAAFTPILATRTRLVNVRRHIGVMKATEIISCSDILHPGGSVGAHGEKYHGSSKTEYLEAVRGEKRSAEGGDNVSHSKIGQ